MERVGGKEEGTRAHVLIVSLTCFLAIQEGDKTKNIRVATIAWDHARRAKWEVTISVGKCRVS